MSIFLLLTLIVSFIALAFNQILIGFVLLVASIIGIIFSANSIIKTYDTNGTHGERQESKERKRIFEKESNAYIFLALLIISCIAAAICAVNDQTALAAILGLTLAVLFFAMFYGIPMGLLTFFMLMLEIASNAFTVLCFFNSQTALAIFLLFMSFLLLFPTVSGIKYDMAVKRGEKKRLMDRFIDFSIDSLADFFKKIHQRMKNTVYDKFKLFSPIIKYCIVAPVVLAFFYFISIAELEYGYYVFVRILTLFVLGAVIIAYAAEKDGLLNFPCIASAIVLILFNPIIPITFEKETWAVLDVLSAFTMLAVTGYILYTAKPEEPAPPQTTKNTTNMSEEDILNKLRKDHSDEEILNELEKQFTEEDKHLINIIQNITSHCENKFESALQILTAEDEEKIVFDDLNGTREELDRKVEDVCFYILTQTDIVIEKYIPMCLLDMGINLNVEKTIHSPYIKQNTFARLDLFVFLFFHLYDCLSNNSWKTDYGFFFDTYWSLLIEKFQNEIEKNIIEEIIEDRFKLYTSLPSKYGYTHNRKYFNELLYALEQYIIKDIWHRNPMRKSLAVIDVFQKIELTNEISSLVDISCKAIKTVAALDRLEQIGKIY